MAEIVKLTPNIRVPLSSYRRFQIFKRDKFTCQYCGRVPPAVILEVDHILPVSKGGDNNNDNLLTACFDCNRGKANGTLEAVALDPSVRAEELKERARQIKAYERLLLREKKRRATEIDEIGEIFNRYFPQWVLNEHARVSVGRFLDQLAPSIVADAMEIACVRMNQDRAFRYFCGICWKRIKGGQGGSCP